MREIIWGWLTAAIGFTILVLLAFHGLEFGTWVDEAGPLRLPPPSIILPVAIGALGCVLFVGGLMVGFAASAEHKQHRR